MINIIKQEITMEESLKQRLEFICEFSHTTPTFINGFIHKVDKTNLSYVEPHRIIINILEGLKKLDEIIPGVNNDETLLYGPEIKFFSNEIITNKNMKLDNYDVYFIGDGAGKAGNIVTAAATGLVAARDILEKLK